MLTLYVALVAAVAAERLVELRLSARHASRALARGGVEAGRGHRRVMELFHAAFLVACPLEAWLLDRPWIPALAIPCLALVAATMALRYWAIAALGERWNTRVICVPGEPAVVRGPYRWIRHPNYLAVAIEVVALPLVHAAWWTAAAFGTVNLLLLGTRIRAEERALAEHCDYAERLGDRPRFLPGRPR